VEKEIKPFQWTRIIKADHMHTREINLFEGLEDLIESEGMDLEDKCDEITSY
jgi:hypothetical protein